MPDKSPPTKRATTDEKSAKRRRNVVRKSVRESAAPYHAPGETTLPETVGSIFRSAREAQRLSQEQVAELTNGRPGQISRTAVSDIERGRCLPGLEALVSLSRVLKIEPAEVLERIDLSMTVPVDLTGVSLEDLLRQGEELLWAGDYRKALSVYDAMFEHLVLSPPDDEAERQRWLARLEINRAVALRRCSAMKAAQASAQRAVELSGDTPHLQAEAFMVLASILSHDGLHTLAHMASQQAAELAGDADATLHGRALTQRGNVLYRMGRAREAYSVFLAARKALLKTTRYHDRIKVEGNLGACLLEFGERTTARTRFKKAVEQSRTHQAPAAEAFWLVELGRMALDDENFDQADTYAKAALRIAKPAEQYLTIFRAEWLLHLIVLAKDPEAPDRHRLAYLRKLYTRVQEHQGWSVIKEFEAAVLRPAEGKNRRPS